MLRHHASGLSASSRVSISGLTLHLLNLDPHSISSSVNNKSNGILKEKEERTMVVCGASGVEEIRACHGGEKTVAARGASGMERTTLSSPEACGRRRLEMDDRWS